MNSSATQEIKVPATSAASTPETHIKIVEVLTKHALQSWVRFPTDLYRGNAFFVPFLENDELDTFSGDKKKNPAYEFCETRLFLAYKNGVV